MNTGRKLIFIFRFKVGLIIPVIGLSALMFSAPVSAEERLQSERLVTRVLQANPGISALQSAIKAAEARTLAAGLLADPQLSYMLAANTIDSAIGTRQIVQLSQALPWHGKRAAESAAAAYQSTAQSEDYRSGRLAIAALARSLYADWLFLHQALEANKQNQRWLHELSQIAKTLYSAGRASQQDVLRAEIRRTELRQQAAVLVGRQQAVRARLNAALHLPVDGEQPPPEEMAKLLPLPDHEVLIQATTENSPVLRAWQARVQASEARAVLAEKSFFPDFRLQAAYIGTLDPVEKRLQVGVALNLPLDRDKRRAKLDEALANAQRLKWLEMEQKDVVMVALADALADAKVARESIRLYRDELLPLARQNRQAARAQYRSGDVDFLTVIDAEQQLLASTIKLAEAEAMYFKQIAALHRDSGGRLVSAFAIAEQTQGAEHE